jgi:hypothetical protein
MKHKNFLVLFAVAFLLLSACAKPVPNNVEDVCSIFQQYPEWYWDAKECEWKWGIPVAVQMAIIYQESSFRAHAKPPRKKILWVIPWKRPSSAYGYSQALTNTWKEYEMYINRSSKRHKFDHATDFIGWYSKQVHHRLKVAPSNAYALYLAYHDGMGGYERRTYLKKPWLIRTAHKVSYRAIVYTRQLTVCAQYIKKT